METTQIKPTEDWRGLTIYQVMVSSFIHDPSGAIGYDDLWGPSGETKNGNLKGVIDALDHINHNSATYLRNRYAQSLQLGFVLAGGFCHSPFVVKSDDALAA